MQLRPLLLLLLLVPLMAEKSNPVRQRTQRTVLAAANADKSESLQIDAAKEAVARLHAHLEDVRSAWTDEDLLRAACARRPPGLPDPVRRLIGDPDGAGRLWLSWSRSAAAAWTPQQVRRWAQPHLLAPSAARHRKLPISQGISGLLLPLLTEPNGSATAPLLVGLEAEERRRLAARATELLLYGPSRRPPTVIQHLILATLGFLGLGGVWLVCVQKKFVDDHRRVFAGRSSHLVHAEKLLADLQEKLASAEQQSAKAAEEKLRLEEAYKREIARLKDRAWRLSHERRRSIEDGDAATQLALAEQELVHVRALLEQAASSSSPDSSGDSGDNGGVGGGVRRSGAGPPASAELLHLLRLCYETELRYCSGNRLKAEEQLARASESLQKLLRKQYTVLGVFRSAFNLTDMINHVEQEIVTAKDFADKVKLDIQERIQRWSRVEELMDIEIIPKQVPPPIAVRNFDNIRSYAVRWKLKTATETSMRRMAMENAAAASLSKAHGTAAAPSIASASASDAASSSSTPASPSTVSASSSLISREAKEEIANQLRKMPVKRNSVPSIGLGRILADSQQALREAETSGLRRRSQPSLPGQHQQQQQQPSPLTASKEVIFSVPLENEADAGESVAAAEEAAEAPEEQTGLIRQLSQRQLTSARTSSASLATTSSLTMPSIVSASIATTAIPTAVTATVTTLAMTTANVTTASIATASIATASMATASASSSLGLKRRSAKLLKYFSPASGGKSK